MGVGTWEVLFWSSFAGLAVVVEELCRRRLCWVKQRTGTTAWARMTDRVVFCRVCKQPMPEKVDVETDTCGSAGCVRVVMVGRVKMARSRVETETALVEVTAPGYWADGKQMFTDDGEPMMFPVPESYERIHVPGGALNDRDRAALAWAAENGA